jgi:Ca2+-binding RTX toxin-like protein
MATVNGTTTSPTSEGVVESSGNGDDVAGGSGRDILQGNGGNDTYFGGAGNDTFVVTQNSLENSSGSTQGAPASAVIFDFQGAGAWSKTSNDFLALEGFGAGSTLTFLHYGNSGGAQDNTLQYYDVHSSTTGNDYTIFIHSTDGSQLAAGDFQFYG